MSLSYAFNYNDFAKHAAKQNLSPADKQMKYQSMLSDSAHQREVQDLQAAGLNPVLSANGGSGASTPTGVLDDSMSSGSGGSGGSAKTAKKKLSNTDKLTKALVKTSDSTAKAVSKTANAVSDIVRKEKAGSEYDALEAAKFVANDFASNEKHVSSHSTSSHNVKKDRLQKSVYPYSMYYDWYPMKRQIRAYGKSVGLDVPHYEYEISKALNGNGNAAKIYNVLTGNTMPAIKSVINGIRILANANFGRRQY